MQGKLLGLGEMECSASMSASEDMAWDVTGGCLGLGLANVLNVVGTKDEGDVGFRW